MVIFKEKYLKELTERIKEHTEILAKGSAQNFSEYKNSCGYIQGLEASRSLFKELYEETIQKEIGITDD